MKNKIALGMVTAIISLLVINGIAMAGTYKNISTQQQQYTAISGVEKMAQPNEEVQTYDLLDQINSAVWQQTDPEPYYPLTVFDGLVEAASAETKSLAIDLNTHMVVLNNLSTNTDERVIVYLNSESNPFPIILEPATTDNTTDTIQIINDKKIGTIYFEFLGAAGGKVKVQVLP